MAVKKILLLGNEKLYKKSVLVRKSELKSVKIIAKDLHDTLMDFRKKYGIGRAIAAPQISVLKRIIYMHIEKPVLFINPKLEFLGKDMFEIWDDCMSFPGLKVKVLRYKKCKVTYKDANWNDCVVILNNALSELIQHEYDHLEGILATQRAIDKKSLKIVKEKYIETVI
jgi:peptide deformylase